MFKHTIGDDALKTFSYANGENSNDWRVVMSKMEKHCIGEVNEIYERYCFNKRYKLSIESVDIFVAELKTLAKTCNFCDCLRDGLIRDRIVLGIGNEQTTKLLRIRDLTLNKCIAICRSEEIAEVQMKTLSEPVDGSDVHQVTSKVRRQSVDGKSKKISCKFCGYEHQFDRKKCPAWEKTCNRCKGKNHFAKRCKEVSVYNIESEEESEEIRVVRIQAVKGRAVYAKMLVRQEPIQFQVDCGASANILPQACRRCGTLPLFSVSGYVERHQDQARGNVCSASCKPRNGMKYKVRFLVVQENLTSLLGLNATEKMGLLTVTRRTL